MKAKTVVSGKTADCRLGDPDRSDLHSWGDADMPIPFLAAAMVPATCVPCRRTSARLRAGCRPCRRRRTPTCSCRSSPSGRGRWLSTPVSSTPTVMLLEPGFFCQARSAPIWVMSPRSISGEVVAASGTTGGIAGFATGGQVRGAGGAGLLDAVDATHLGGEVGGRRVRHDHPDRVVRRVDGAAVRADRAGDLSGLARLGDDEVRAEPGLRPDRRRRGRQGGGGGDETGREEEDQSFAHVPFKLPGGPEPKPDPPAHPGVRGDPLTCRMCARG